MRNFNEPELSKKHIKASYETNRKNKDTSTVSRDPKHTIIQKFHSRRNTLLKDN